MTGERKGRCSIEVFLCQGVETCINLIDYSVTVNDRHCLLSDCTPPCVCGGFMDFIRCPKSKILKNIKKIKITTFRKLTLLPSSGEGRGEEKNTY
jgi:hypothetical protein